MPEEPKVLTLGEYRVGITFNPGQNKDVEEVKRRAADLIDCISNIRIDEHDNGEVSRSKALAMTHVENAAMWAVKAATKPANVKKE